MNLATGLDKRGHEVLEIHLRPPYGEIEDTIKGIDVYRVPKERLDRDLLEKYYEFKEAVYKEAHGEEKCFDKPAEEMPGFEEYSQINETIGKQVRELLSDHPAQVVHIHDFQLLFLYKYIPRGIPLVFTWHIPFSKKMSKNLSSFLVDHMKEFDQVIFSTPDYIDAAKDAGLPKKNSEMIYPICNTNLFKPIEDKKKYRKKHGIPQKARVILCVQRIDPKSGHEQLVKAMPSILKKIPEARLVFVGGESMSSKISDARKKYVKRVKKLIKDRNLSRKVIFVGNVDYEKMPEVYSTADVVALTSKQEGFGLSITEAMACGKPVVGNNTTGIKFQIENGKNGYLVKVDDYKKTAKYISKILSDEKLAKKMGKHSLKVVDKKFKIEKGITKHIKLYKELLQDKTEKWTLERLSLENVEGMVLDFDRTLTVKPGKLNKKAFKKLKSLKKPLVLASGRNIEFMKEFSKKHSGFKAIVAENGAVIYFPKNKEIITMDTEPMKRTREKIKREYPELSVGSVVVHAPVEMEKELKKTLGKKSDVKFVKNVDRIMILPKTVDKGAGVLMALHKLGIDSEKTIVVGDGENDVDLFNVPGFRVAVANAVPRVKTLADQVMEKKSAKGVIEMVEKLEE